MLHYVWLSKYFRMYKLNNWNTRSSNLSFHWKWLRTIYDDTCIVVRKCDIGFYGLCRTLPPCMFNFQFHRNKKQNFTQDCVLLFYNWMWNINIKKIRQLLLKTFINCVFSVIKIFIFMIILLSFISNFRYRVRWCIYRNQIVFYFSVIRVLWIWTI